VGFVGLLSFPFLSFSTTSSLHEQAPYIIKSVGGHLLDIAAEPED
jgi:hypothetical protein